MDEVFLCSWDLIVLVFGLFCSVELTIVGSISNCRSLAGNKQLSTVLLPGAQAIGVSSLYAGPFVAHVFSCILYPEGNHDPLKP